MSSSSIRKPIKAASWRKLVQGLPNSGYFISKERPEYFDFVEYLTALNPSSSDRIEIEDTWNNSVIRRLRSSSVESLADAGRRLAREWYSKKGDRCKFWKDLGRKENEEDDNERRKRRLERLKVTADIRLEDAESLLVDEARADIEEERLKLVQAKNKSLLEQQKTTRGLDLAGREESKLHHGSSTSHLTALAQRQLDEFYQAHKKCSLPIHKSGGNANDEGDGEASLLNLRGENSSETATLSRLDSRPSLTPVVTTKASTSSQLQTPSSLSSSSSSTPVSAASSTTSTAGALSPKRKRKGSIVETEEPWQSLMRCLIKIVNGETDINFPAEQPTMPHIHNLLFQHAVETLRIYVNQPIKERDMLMKDAQVAMSCLINTISGRTCSFFDQLDPNIIPRARRLCEIQRMDDYPATGILKKYEDVLVDKGVHQLSRRAAQDLGKLYEEYSNEDVLPISADLTDRTLQVLLILCKFVTKPPFGKKQPSENDILMLWVSVLSVLARNVTFHTGEKVMAASKAVRQMQSSEFGDPSDSGRKADCLFMMGDIELSNIEFKRQGIDETEIRIQNRKNVRLGRCLQESHAKYGIEAPSVLMADVAGYSGVVYQVVQMDGVAVAGKATPHVVQLPCTEGGLMEFMTTPTLAILWNFMNHLEAQGSRLQRWKDRHEAAADRLKMHQGLSERTSMASIFKKFENNVTMSPPKKRTL
ncbi:hypothetical protein EMPS_07341 [Entomortierella parvispora]|uniref:Uncharacterized protein n=1 Tax=Entomortierella parvispora TaxID=205924 RepID=A0A9P3HED8_9FUNG|nr:hypothetical protein EMPS_07341 [Entomortierella parvispora]